MKEEVKDIITTFIIPTIGRPSLINTINSLLFQTNPNWKAIIIFDGIEPTINTSLDPRINIIKCPKLGEGKNSAGNVRNFGIKQANTLWVSFLDDDDVISYDYIETLINELKYNVDIIIFRMIINNRILPTLDTYGLIGGEVGIGFSIKKSIFDDGHIFYPSYKEDYDYLIEASNKKYKLMISPYIKYFVHKYNSCPLIGNRIFI